MESDSESSSSSSHSMQPLEVESTDDTQTFEFDSTGRTRHRKKQGSFSLIIFSFLFVLCFIYVFSTRTNQNVTTVVHKPPLRDDIDLTIAFTADTHGVVENFPQLIKVVEKLRSERENFLLFDIGDISIGTPFFRKFGMNGMATLMQNIGYDAMGWGNHDMEFPNDVDEFIKTINIPVISANANMSSIKPSLILRKFETKGNKLIGLVGYTNLDSVLPEPEPWDRILGQIQEQILSLRNQNVDVIILLSHAGLALDLRLRDVLDVDVILGSHTHVVHQDLERPILLHNGAFGTHLGLLKIKSGNATYERINYEETSERDASMVALEDTFFSQLHSTPLATVETPVSTCADRYKNCVSHSIDCRKMECMVGHFFADFMRFAFPGHPTAISLREAGSIRGMLPSNTMTNFELEDLVPWANELLCLKGTGAMVRDMLEHGMRSKEGEGGAMLSVGGLTYLAQDDKVIYMKRCLRSEDETAMNPSGELPVMRLVYSGLCEGVPLKETDSVIVVVTRWIYEGGDNFGHIFKKHNPILLQDGISEVDAAKKFLSHSPIINISPRIEEMPNYYPQLLGISGALAAGLQTIMLADLLRLQTQMMAGTFQSFAQFYKSDCCLCGDSTFTKAFAVMFQNAIYWFLISYLFDMVDLSEFTCVTIAAVINTVVGNPLWVIVTVMDTDIIPIHEAIGRVHSLYGISGFMNGIWFNILLCIFPIIRDSAYVWFVNWGSIGSRIASSLVAQFVTYPIQTLAVMQQTIHKKDTSNRSILHLYDGFRIKIVNTIVTTAFFFTVKHILDDWIVDATIGYKWNRYY